MLTREKFQSVLNALRSLDEVSAVGKSGGVDLPADGIADIDLYVYGEKAPGPVARKAAYQRWALEIIKLQEGEGGSLWGTVDFVGIDGEEICVMYYTMRETSRYIEEVLEGKLPDKTHNYFYPTGRAATIQTMGLYYDETGFLAGLQERVRVYPEALSRILVSFHQSRLRDTEDLERAVSRGDSLFFHFALDIALDHFLQALFAMNFCYFHSRKRSMEHIQGFSTKPENCADRLADIVRLGGSARDLSVAYQLWQRLVSDLSYL